MTLSQSGASGKWFVSPLRRQVPASEIVLDPENTIHVDLTSEEG